MVPTKADTCQNAKSMIFKLLFMKLQDAVHSSQVAERMILASFVNNIMPAKP